MQISITKILDGIFTGDQFVATDFQFIFGNKVSHIIGWSFYPLDLNMQEQGVYHLNLLRTVEEDSFPSYYDICNAIRFIQNSRDQCLCCLIFSDKQSDAAILLAPYMMFKYKWNLDTSLEFIRRKIPIPEISQQLYTKLQNIQSNILCNLGLKQLKNIEWKYEFLKDYQAQDSEQMIVINTVKNTLRTFSPQQINEFEQNRTKKEKRIQWYDKVPRPVSSQVNQIQFPRGSTPMKRTSKHLFSKALTKKQILNFNIYDSNNSNQNVKKSWRPGNSLSKANKQQQDFLNDDTDFFQLKQLSRTHIQDTSNKGKIRKRSNLKHSRSDKSIGSQSKQNRAFNINNLSYNKKKANNFLSVNTMSAKDFLNNLKNLSKMGSNA